MPTLAQTASDMIDAGMSIHEAEKAIRKCLIEEALLRKRGNQTKAAKLLKFHRNNIRHWIEELEINVDSFRVQRKSPKRAVKFVPHQEMRA